MFWIEILSYRQKSPSRRRCHNDYPPVVSCGHDRHTCDRSMAVLPTMLATMRYSSVWSCEHVLGFRRVVGA
jgi:hypothetical protein